MKNIFCLETEWNLYPNKKMKDKTRVQPLLIFLEQSEKMNYIFRNVASRTDLMFYLNQLKRKLYKDYDIIYLSFHGSSQKIELAADDELVELKELGDLCEGLFANKIVHFGSCRTFQTSEEKIIQFKQITLARIVSGYTRSVDFVRSSILDIAYFTELDRTKNLGTMKNKMDRRYGGLCEELGFQIK